MTVPEIVNELLWSAGGLVVGYLLGRLTRRATDVDQSYDDSRARQRERRQDIARAIIGTLILLLATIASVRYYQVTACQQDYLRAVQVALTERSEAQGREARAQIELLTAQTGGDRERSRAAIAEYIAAISELERVRTANPLPPPDSCGEG